MERWKSGKVEKCGWKSGKVEKCKRKSGKVEKWKSAGGKVERFARSASPALGVESVLRKSLGREAMRCMEIKFNMRVREFCRVEVEVSRL